MSNREAEGSQEGQMFQYASRGIIEEIQLVNFMCHGNLNIKLGRNVNFIHGLNGSGKSAILIAICSCFGLKASSTRRATSLKELIQHGKNKAEISLRILNESEDAFRPELYGRTITITRIISRTDSSSKYKIISDRGSTVATTKAEMLAIRNHFNIHVDNPCVVLNQENAREFLQDANPKTQYQYFLKATQLLQLKDHIESVQMHQEEMRLSLKAQEAAAEKASVEFQDVSSEIKEYKELENIDAEISEARANLIWASVIFTEKEFEKAAASKQSHLNAVEKFESSLKKKREKLDIVNEEKNEKQRDYDSLMEKIEAESSELNDCKSSLKKIRNKLDSSKEEIKEILGKVKKQEKQKKKLQDELAIFHENNQLAALEQRVSEIKLDLQNLRERETEKAKALEDCRKQFEEHGKEERALRNQLDQSRHTCTSEKRRIDTIKNAIDGIDKSTKDRGNLFVRESSKISELIDHLVKQKKFTVAPIGPLGQYIGVKEEQWSTAIESCLKSVLSAYVVDNSRDRQLLQQVFLKAGVQRTPTIFVNSISSNRYSIKRLPKYLENHRDLFSIQQATEQIKVANDWAFNLIIDVTHLEHILLCPNYKDAHTFLPKIYKENREADDFVNAAFTRTGEKITYKFTSLSLDPPGRIQNLLAGDQGAIKQKYIDDLRLAKESFKEAESEFKEVQSEYNSCKSLLNSSNETVLEAKREHEHIVQKIRAQETELNELHEEMRTESSDISLRVELEDVEQVISDLTRSQEVIQSRRQELKERQAEVVERLHALEEQSLTKVNEVERITEELKEKVMAVDNVKSEIVKLEATLRKARQDLARISSEAEDAEAKVTKFLDQANAKFPGRREVEESIDFCRTEYRRLKERKETEEARLDGRSYEEVYKEFLEKKTKKAKLNADLVAATTSFESLALQSQRRSAEWHRFHRKLKDVVTKEFYYSLESQGYSGDLLFNDKEQTLQIEFDRRGTSEASSSDTKTLSGGERSFSTLCFIVAIGHAILTPFVAFDEFDIFMVCISQLFLIDRILSTAEYPLISCFDWLSVNQPVNLFSSLPMTFRT